MDAGGYHRAEADAKYCGHLFAKMVEKISPIGHSPQMSQLITLTGKPELKFPVVTKSPKQLGFLEASAPAPATQPGNFLPA
jgi:DNA polymerase-3 subunit epsilon